MYDVVIIGAGVAGTFLARELARYQLRILMVDKENDVANETTAANSAIIHAGYDAPAKLLKGRFNASGNAMFDAICEELDVPFQRIGSLVIGFDERDRRTLQKLYENGLRNKVPDMRILNHDEIIRMEPNINTAVTCALYAPTAGIIEPWELAAALAENALENGAELALETEVTDIKKLPSSYIVITNKGEFKTRYVINCAGVYADKISNMVTEPYFTIHPRKGNYMVLDKEVDGLVHHVIFQCPNEKGKGVVVTPTVRGNVLVGPDSEFVDEKDDVGTEMARLNYVRMTALRSFPGLPYNKVIRTFAGLRATSDLGDFIIEEARGAKGFVNVAGFESPGLSSVPAVAEYVVELMKKIAGGLTVKEDFNPRRRKVIRFNQLSEEEKRLVILENPSYGRMVCRCESVTEGEIVDAICRKAGARSVKAVKKRTGAGFGRCQGGFCSPKVVEILARELGKSWKDIPYDSTEAYILTEETKNYAGYQETNHIPKEQP